MSSRSPCGSELGACSSASANAFTNPQLNLTDELLFPDLADGANFNLPQARG